MEWISVKDKSPQIGQIVVGLLSSLEPVCVKYDLDRFGPIWVELQEIDRYIDREDIITHWISLPELPKE